MVEALQEKFESTAVWFTNSGADFVIGVMLFAAFYFAGSVIRKLLLKRAAKKPERGVVYGFIGNVVMAVFIVFGISLFMNEMGWSKVMTGLLAGAGFISIIVGIAFKDIAENFLAGILLAFSRPFTIGDLLEVNGTVGRVLQLNLRNTHMRTGEGRDVFVPNSMLINRVLTNYTRDGLMRHHFFLGIDYDEDINKAMQTAMASIQENTLIEQEGMYKPYLLIDTFGESTISIKVFFWTNLREIEVSSAIIKSRVMKTVYEALRTAKISMPGNILEIKNYQPIGNSKASAAE
ncbi:MAG: mechanosensitive ion channel family protein [Cryomorphaceae bacterium]|nr:mechanosensitive ion channel family protein [Flavobacteriales bacterium]